MSPGDLVSIAQISPVLRKNRRRPSLWKSVATAGHVTSQIDIDWDALLLVVAVNDGWVLVTDGTVLGWRMETTVRML